MRFHRNCCLTFHSPRRNQSFTLFFALIFLPVHIDVTGGRTLLGFDRIWREMRVESVPAQGGTVRDTLLGVSCKFQYTKLGFFTQRPKYLPKLAKHSCVSTLGNAWQVLLEPTSDCPLSRPPFRRTMAIATRFVSASLVAVNFNLYHLQPIFELTAKGRNTRRFPQGSSAASPVCSPLEECLA